MAGQWDCRCPLNMPPTLGLCCYAPQCHHLPSFKQHVPYGAFGCLISVWMLGEKVEQACIMFWQTNKLTSIMDLLSLFLPSSNMLLDQQISCTFLQLQAIHASLGLNCWKEACPTQNHDNNRQLIGAWSITKTILCKATKSIDMCFNWLKYWQAENQFIYQ